MAKNHVEWRYREAEVKLNRKATVNIDSYLDLVDELSFLLSRIEALQEGIVSMGENGGTPEAVAALAYMSLDHIRTVHTKLQEWYETAHMEANIEPAAPAEDYSDRQPWKHEPGRTAD